jgi:hypothetical protein
MFSRSTRAVRKSRIDPVLGVLYNPAGRGAIVDGTMVPVKGSSCGKAFLTGRNQHIFCNGAFHGGIFAWLALLLISRYHLHDTGIGPALAGYGLPGIFFGTMIGR